MTAGMWAATVTRTSADGPYVVVPRLDQRAEFGPCLAVAGALLAAGDKVLVSPLEGRPDELVVVGALEATAAPHTHPDLATDAELATELGVRAAADNALDGRLDVLEARTLTARIQSATASVVSDGGVQLLADFPLSFAAAHVPFLSTVDGFGNRVPTPSPKAITPGNGAVYWNNGQLAIGTTVHLSVVDAQP